MSKDKSKTSGLVVCETTAAITTHYRTLSPEHPLKLGGHHPRPATFCGMEAAWDTELPTVRQNGDLAARCRVCLAVAHEMRARGELP